MGVVGCGPKVAKFVAETHTINNESFEWVKFGKSTYKSAWWHKLWQFNLKYQTTYRLGRDELPVVKQASSSNFHPLATAVSATFSLWTHNPQLVFKSGHICIYIYGGHDYQLKNLDTTRKYI